MSGDCRSLAEQMKLGSSADDLLTGGRARRQEMTEHLRTCVACRRVVVEEDPTLTFSLLESETLDESEIAQVQSAVRTLRRSRAIDRGDDPRPDKSWKIEMVAASLLCALALLPLTGERAFEEVSEPQVEGAAELPPRDRPGWPQWVGDRAQPPVIEELNRPEARVYQLTEEDLSVVMIVDETLDL